MVGWHDLGTEGNYEQMEQLPIFKTLHKTYREIRRKIQERDYRRVDSIIKKMLEDRGVDER